MANLAPTRIALADDHTILRRGLVALFNSFPDYEVVLEAADGKELTEALAQGAQVDIAIVDLNMPHMDGWEAITWMNKTCPEIKALALTFDNCEDTVIRTVRAGARGFLLKTVDTPHFKIALDSIRDTGYYESDLVHELIVTKGEPRTPYERQRDKVLERITPREMEFIIYACDPAEYTYEQIAGLMKVEPSTIETHRKNLYERFGIRSKPGIVIFAYRWGIVKVVHK